MTFPSVATVNYSEEVADTTSHDVLLPSGITAGDRLVLWAVLDGNPTISGMPSGWSQISRALQGVNVCYEVWEKIAAGGETDFAYTSSALEQSVNRTWRVSGAHASSPMEVAGSTPNSFGSSVNLPAITPTWGIDDTLWIIFTALNRNTTISSFDDGTFTDNQFTDSDGTAGGTGIGLASKNLNGSSTDPTNPSMTFSGSTEYVGSTFAIRPSSAAAPPTRKLRVVSSPLRW